jgi:methionine-rich copper-binding protein CopC
MPITTGFIKGGNFVTIIPGRELEYSTVYTVKIGPGMSDPEGNRLKSEFSFAFTTAPKPDLTPPAVSRVEPREDSAQVLIDAPVRVYLTEPVDPASLDENSLLIRDSKGTILPGKMHYQRQDMMLEFLGKGPFEYKNIYTAELRAGLSDMAGNRLNSAKIWKFSTVNPPDRNAPRIISTHPFEGEKSVSVATTVKVFLSETVAPACFDQKPVELFDLQGVVEKSSLNWDSTLKAFILSPDRHLKHGQEYRVVVSKKIHDPAGNHLGESLIYSFFTELPPDHVRPELVSCSPLPETRDVEPNQIIRLTFTESLKPVTVNVDTAYLETCDNQKIPCQVDFLEGKFMITLRPLQNMPWDTDMRVFVSRKVTDPSGNPLASTVVVPFRTRPAPDTIAPTLVKSNPSHGAGGVSVDASLRLYFSEPLSDRHLHEDTISLITTGIDENRVVECRISWVPDGNTLVVTPARRLNFEREYKLQVTSFQDLAGNKNKENLSLVFRTETAPDREPPRVVFSLPSSDGDVISHKDQIRVRFSEPLLLESINGASVDLRDLEGTLAANVDWNGADNTLLVKPDHGLKPGREYFLRVGSGIQDLFRNNLANPLRIHFSTREIEDRIPPKVVKIYPANGAVKVSETQKIRAIFSEKIDIRSVNRHTVILEDEGERMATHLQLNDEGQLDIRPTESLRSGRQYRVTLTEGICDSKGNALKTPLSWAFIVGVSEVDRELKIVSLTPHEGMKNVNPAARIAVRFNNPIDPASLNPYTFIVMKNGRRIKGDVTLTEDGREAVFNVSGQLTPGVEYMVRLTEGVRNQFARSLKRSKEWAFTTSGEKVMSKK